MSMNRFTLLAINQNIFNFRHLGINNMIEVVALVLQFAATSHSEIPKLVHKGRLQKQVCLQINLQEKYFPYFLTWVNIVKNRLLFQ